jgi:hypothetical protein
LLSKDISSHGGLKWFLSAMGLLETAALKNGRQKKKKNRTQHEGRWDLLKF